VLKFRFSHLRLCIALASAIFLTSACTVGSKAKEDSTWSVETQQLETEAATYVGPLYTIGIIEFDNQALAAVSGVSEVSSLLLSRQLETAGLNTAQLDEYSPTVSDKPIVEQRPGVVKVGKAGTDNSLDAPDYRLSGAITAYSEVEEGTEATASGKKSVVARVSISYALIDITTGRQLLAESVTGEHRKASSAEAGQDASTPFNSELRDGALRNALAKATANVTRNLGNTPFKGRLLAVDGPTLVLKAGNRTHLKDGEQLTVYRVKKSLIDPDSGLVLGYKESKIGVIQISSHLSESLSLAKVVSGSGFMAGDVARLTP